MHEITALRNEYYSWREIQIEKVTAIQGKLDHLPAQLETLATKIALKTSEQLSRRPTWLYAGIVAALLALSSSLIVALVTTGGRSL